MMVKRNLLKEFYKSVLWLVANGESYYTHAPLKPEELSTDKGEPQYWKKYPLGKYMLSGYTVA